jgi:putative transcriptional regulator
MLAAIALPATILKAALPNPEQAPVRPSLAGQLLVAAPSMGDPRFANAVILMVQDDKTGAMGLIINKPIGERSIASLLEALGQKGASVAGNVRIFLGGPVQPEAGFVLHSADYHRPETIAIGSRFALTSSAEILRDIGNKKGPAKSLVIFGYAGWALGQLQGEMQKRAWGTADADPTVVFDEDREKVWEDAWEHRTQDL